MKKALALIVMLIMSLGLSTCAQTAPNPERDYTAEIRESALSGNIRSGRSAADARNELIREGLLAERSFSFDDLFLLSKFIFTQAERFSLSEECLMCSGEVILNRISSPEFPDSMEEVIFSDPTYSEIMKEYSENELLPPSKCVDIALRLLMGERMLPSSVVYQTKDDSGDVYASFCDRVLGFTYFCCSEHPEYYLEGPPEPIVFSPSIPQPLPTFSVNEEILARFKDSKVTVYACCEDSDD